MEQQNFLIGFAQLALVLTGFVSVFVVFHVDEASKSRVNTHHATCILLVALSDQNRLRPPCPDTSLGRMSKKPFRYLNTSPEIIRLAVMMFVRFPLSLRNVEDLLHERGIDVCHESVRHWWNRFGPMFASEIRKKQSHSMRQGPQWR